MRKSSLRPSLLFTSAVMTAVSLTAKAGLTSEQKARFEQAPIWMSSYDEYQDFLDTEKQMYMDKLKASVDKAELIKKIDDAEWKEASEWYATWERLRLRIYEACDKKPDSCERIENARLDTLDQFSSRREALEPKDEESLDEVVGKPARQTAAAAPVKKNQN